MSVELSLPLLSAETPPPEHRDGPAVRAWLGSMRDGAPLETAYAVIARLSALNRGKVQTLFFFLLLAVNRQKAKDRIEKQKAAFSKESLPANQLAEMDIKAKHRTNKQKDGKRFHVVSILIPISGEVKLVF